VNPSTALGHVLVDELVRCGVREAVLAPGSRSAPLALALHAADAAGRLRLHVRIDERSAGFVALGLAKAADRPVPVVTTSGTAAANLHPAMVEASHAGVPLLALTADRPPELRGVGANQTIDQLGLFGSAVRMFVEVGVPDDRVGRNAAWRALVCRAVAAAWGATGGAPGPVHLNVALRDPLLPDSSSVDADLAPREDGGPWTRLPSPPVPVPGPDDLPARSLVVVGCCRPSVAKQALLLAEARGWPVLSEPSGNARSGPLALTTGDLLLGALPERLTPERVLVVGRPTLTRGVRELLARSSVDVVAEAGTWADSTASAARVLPAVPALTDISPDRAWAQAWHEVEGLARAAVDAVLDGAGLSEQLVARELVDAVPPGSLVVAGSSLPSRHLFLARAKEAVTVLANRGAAGIDGTVSTAIGATLAWQAAGGGQGYALLGDLTFLHDSNGLIAGPDEPRPDLTLVVLNNDGGGIFSTLEQAEARHESAFERVFGTRHGADLEALCGASATAYRLVTSVPELCDALAPGRGVAVVEVRTDRAATHALQQRLAAAVSDAVG
jgi:2-succinyl-5-enolpyruvyl-6-hydroxy-3-cyclohexene-1-carboxylate synthase